MAAGTGEGRGHDSTSACGDEIFFQELLDEILYHMACGNLTLKDQYSTDFLYQVTLPGPGQPTFLLDTLTASGEKKTICAIVYEGTEKPENYLVHIDLTSDHPLYKRVDWLLGFARGEIPPKKIARFQRIQEQKNKLEALVSTLKQGHATTPQAISGADAENLRILLKGVADTIGYWGRKIRKSTKGGNAKKEFVTELLDALDFKEQEILDILEPVKDPERDARGPSVKCCTPSVPQGPGGTTY